MNPPTLNIESEVRILVMDETTNRYVVRPGKIRLAHPQGERLVEVLLDGELREIALSRVFADWGVARAECKKWNEWLDKLPKSDGMTARHTVRRKVSAVTSQRL